MVSSWSDIRLLIAKINGVKRNRNLTVSSLDVTYDPLCLQETKSHDLAHLTKFCITCQGTVTTAALIPTFSLLRILLLLILVQG